MNFHPNNINQFADRWKAPRLSSMDSDDSDSDGQIGVGIQEAEPEIKEPPRYQVLLHNDDYTTMEVVVEVLQKFFGKSGLESEAIMLRVHRNGFGVAGIYSFEVAETKVAQATEFVKSRGFPLKLTLEPES